MHGVAQRTMHAIHDGAMAGLDRTMFLLPAHQSFEEAPAREGHECHVYKAITYLEGPDRWVSLTAHSKKWSRVEHSALHTGVCDDRPVLQCRSAENFACVRCTVLLAPPSDSI